MALFVMLLSIMMQAILTIASVAQLMVLLWKAILYNTKAAKDRAYETFFYGIYNYFSRNLIQLPCHFKMSVL
ncbi:MAG: hypothetical protein Q8K75_04395 [Chlamydiales bacterium]|nr:hypothetical protein [Chlamydiales bacterium]